MRSFTTATRFDHGSKVDGIHARRIRRLSEEEIPDCGTACRAAPARQSNLAEPYLSFEVCFSLPRREVGGRASLSAALFSHSLRSRFISAIIASSSLPDFALRALI